jgi:hypothetical protein
MFLKDNPFIRSIYLGFEVSRAVKVQTGTAEPCYRYHFRAIMLDNIPDIEGGLVAFFRPCVTYLL